MHACQWRQQRAATVGEVPSPIDGWLTSAPMIMTGLLKICRCKKITSYCIRDVMTFDAERHYIRDRSKLQMCILRYNIMKWFQHTGAIKEFAMMLFIPPSLALSFSKRCQCLHLAQPVHTKVITPTSKSQFFLPVL